MPAKVLAVANRKGGVGKTTTAVALAHGLSQKGHPVLLVDLDAQGNVSTSLGVRTNGHGTLSDLLLGRRPIEDCVIPADRSKNGGPSRKYLYLIPSDDSLVEAKDELVLKSFTEFQRRGVDSRIDLFAARLGKAMEVFHYIVLDCPPSMDSLSKAVYYFADEAVVPVKVDYLGASGTKLHTDEIIKRQEQGIDIRIGSVVPTFVRPREILARQVLAAIIQRYGRRIVSAPVPQSVVVEQAPAAGGLTIFEHAPDSPPAKAYRVLVNRYNGSS
jgi:chromosome partitioning protein